MYLLYLNVILFKYLWFVSLQKYDVLGYFCTKKGEILKKRRLIFYKKAFLSIFGQLAAGNLVLLAM